ncbi:tetratricopeptide repeat protein [Steroidobacter sp. S1-65]|uniref:Tetratricopeptide repeat protein n=1 Tax=Steroidobacter gossypii TaxID=2805490 RepID=A0ABS1WZ60_9GAMM|nr:tetratricopeptide repeat protein [Steroidobacter gossypii]MBM0106267.1 tetratricopeptide repeat protein [Steroidobacter gossypii]
MSSVRQDLAVPLLGTMMVAWAMQASPALAAEHEQHALGKVEFPISCSPPAQAQFNQAMALLHHMTYPQAREAFERTIEIEPACAMAHWGVAMTLFQPLWPTRPNAAALARGWEEVRKAKALQASGRERRFIAAAEAFFTEPDSHEYWVRIHRWAVASRQAYEVLPGDDEAALFYALSHLATAPPTASSREHADQAAEILLKVYEKQPDHPGAMHYLVHANDVPGRERELLEVTRKYDAIAPNNPHALHMPTHIYTRLGDWSRVIKGNLRAADASLLHPAGERGELVWDEFAHAIEYLMYAYLQQGADTHAAEQLSRLQSTQRMEPTFKTAFHLASTQARYALERRAWNEAMKIQPRTPAWLDWDRYMWAEAIAQFARGLGAARLGNKQEAARAIQRLAELEGVARRAGEDLFARSIKVLHLELTAWSTHAHGQSARSVEIMREAAELERATPKHAVTPGPTLPALEQLGDLLSEQNKPAEALSAYQSSLKSFPRRFNSLLGAAEAARKSGDSTQARAFYAELLDVAAPDSSRPQVKEARRYVAAGSLP